MASKNLITYFTALALFIIIAGASCKKDEKNTDDNQPEKETATTVSSSMVAYTVLNSAMDILFANGIPNESGRGAFSGRKYGCATVTANPPGLTGFPKNVLVDFGNGCTLRGYHGKGSVSFTLPQWVFTPGTEITPSFNNFFVNDHKIEGKYKITTVSATEYDVEIIDGIITFPNDMVFHLTGTQHYEQTKGAETPLVFGDDVYSITGKITATSSMGNIVGEIKEPLIKEVSCYNLTSGNIVFTDDNNITALLDFGNGECDNKGTIKIGIFTFPVTLPF